MIKFWSNQSILNSKLWITLRNNKVVNNPISTHETPWDVMTPNLFWTETKVPRIIGTRLCPWGQWYCGLSRMNGTLIFPFTYLFCLHRVRWHFTHNDMKNTLEKKVNKLKSPSFDFLFSRQTLVVSFEDEKVYADLSPKISFSIYADILYDF